MTASSSSASPRSSASSKCSRVGLRLSASQLSRALKCSYPYREDVDAGPEEPVGRAAHTGVGFALLREYAIEPERFAAVPVLPMQAQLDVLYEGGRVRAERLVERWLHWWAGYSAGKPGLRWESEIPFAFDTHTGNARRLPVSEHRAYEGALPHEYVGTADMIGVGSKYIVVLDEKTGQKAYVTTARDNAQLRFLSLCLSIITDVRVGKVGLVFPHLEDPLDEVPLTEAGIDAARAEFMELPLKIAVSRPVVGDWCTFCPLKKNGTCPAWVGTEDVFGNWEPKKRRLQIAVSSPAMSTPVRVKHPPVAPVDTATQTAPEPAPQAAPARRKVTLGTPLPGDPTAGRPAVEPADAGYDSLGESGVDHPELTPTKFVRPSTSDDNDLAPKLGSPPRGAPVLRADFERIVDRVYGLDVRKEYDRLEKALKVGERRADRGALSAALDEAEENALVAHALSLVALQERSRWEADAEVVMAPIRKMAVEQLEDEKKRKIRSKDITEADVKALMASLNPDAVKWHADGGGKVRGMEKQIDRLASLWQSRCSSLRILLEKAR